MYLKKKLSSILAFIYKFTIFLNFLIIEPIINIDILGRVRYFILIIDIIIAIIIFIIRNNWTIDKKACIYFCSNVIPYSVILFFMLIKCMKDNINLNNQIIVYLYWIIPICVMQSAIYLLGYKVIDYTFYAIIFNYLFCVIFYLYMYRIDGIIHFFYFVEKKVTPLEVHELIFSIGLFFVYYAFFENKNEKNHKIKIFLSSICIFLGFKRILIFALLIVFIVYKIIKLFCKINRKIIYTLSLFLILFSFLYIDLVKNNFLNQISLKYSINFKSRLEAYNYFDNDYELSIFYSGKGLRYVIDKLKDAGNSLYGIGDLQRYIKIIYRIRISALVIFFYKFHYIANYENEKIF